MIHIKAETNSNKSLPVTKKLQADFVIFLKSVITGKTGAQKPGILMGFLVRRKVPYQKSCQYCLALHQQKILHIFYLLFFTSISMLSYISDRMACT